MTEPGSTYVVVGAGQAGGRAVEAMRAAGFEGRVVLIGEEAHPPYERPPLSKKLLMGEVEVASTYLNRPEFYAENDIEFIAGVRAETLDVGAGRLGLSSGAEVEFDKLLLATGGRVRELAVPGAALGSVYYVRTIDDTLALRAALAEARNVVAVGGGYLGLEAAAAARAMGLEVTVVEREANLLDRVAAPEIGRVVGDLHARHGTHVMTGADVAAVEGEGRARGVRLADGTVLDADAVIVSIGIIPNIELAEAAGCEVGDGIVVDEFGETTVPGIYAAGDVAYHPNGFLGRNLRLESWQNAQNQAIAAARAMCGAPVPYNEVPWFWSDQYGVNIQLAGVPEHWDDVVFRGDPGTDAFSAFYLSAGRVVGVTGFNAAPDVRFGRKLIEAGATADAETLKDLDVQLKDLARQAASTAATAAEGIVAG